MNHLGRVTVRLLDLRAADHLFDCSLAKPQQFNIGSWRFSTTHAAIIYKNEYYLTGSQDKVSEWSEK